MPEQSITMQYVMSLNRTYSTRMIYPILNDHVRGIKKSSSSSKEEGSINSLITNSLSHYLAPSTRPWCWRKSRSTHECTRSCGARKSSMQLSLRGVVRPVYGTGQTSRLWESATADEREPGRDPVRVGARRVVLGSSGHLERLQTSRRPRKNIRWGWKS